jgi:hypothetical protein
MNMNMEELCSKIELQWEVTEKVLVCHENFEYENVREYLEKLYSPKTWDEGVKSLQKSFGEDPSGIKMLTCMLVCALDTYKTYEKKGIPEEIFIATMKIFSRFVDEHFDSYGTYGFNMGWWTPRQISANEFRIGELEYEIVDENGKKVISMHIPSDAVMKQPELRQSYLDARKFFNDFYPEYAAADMICNSWLLSPALKELLPEDSNIVRFQKSFYVDYVDYENNNFLIWVYKRMDIPWEQLPEETSLQRRIKSFILSGGKIGWANGKLISHPFLA